MLSDEVLDIARRVGGVASASELIRGGARWEDLYQLRDEGALDRAFPRDLPRC